MNGKMSVSEMVSAWNSRIDEAIGKMAFLRNKDYVYVGVDEEYNAWAGLMHGRAYEVQVYEDPSESAEKKIVAIALRNLAISPEQAKTVRWVRKDYKDEEEFEKDWLPVEKVKRTVGVELSFYSDSDLVVINLPEFELAKLEKAFGIQLPVMLHDTTGYDPKTSILNSLFIRGEDLKAYRITATRWE